MKVYVVRHAAAEDAGPGRGDAERRLTSEGRRDFEESVRGLAALGVRLDGIFTSPLVRARETAAILAATLPGPLPEVLDVLGPAGGIEAVLRALRGAADRIAVVGHEPSLGHLVSLAATGVATDGMPLRKGGVACLAFPGTPRPKGATLSWLLTPKQLRRLASG
jgi:phosphohistidine phosphatase